MYIEHQKYFTDNKDSYYAWVLFLIWPLLSVISAFKNYQKPWAKNIFWGFCAFYGFTFAIGTESEGSDIVRYVSEFQQLYGTQMTWSAALEYFQESGEVDILRTFIAVSLSRFTGSQSVLTLVYGIIFGFFFSRNFWYIMEQLKGKLAPITVLLLICFFLINPIWNINGFRMWTATHIFLYGLLPYLIENKKNSLWICFSALLVHFSFIVPLIVLMGYLLLGNRLVLYFSFFLITFFISEINLTEFNSLVENYAPEALQERSESYRSESQVELYREGSEESTVRWYAVWYKSALNWAVAGFLIVLFFSGRNFFYENKHWLSLFCFTLCLYGVGNIMSSLPSGGRYLVIANLCAVALITLYVQNKPREKGIRGFIYIAFPALLLFVVVAIRIGVYSMSAASVLGNPILAMFFIEDQISLNDLLKMII